MKKRVLCLALMLIMTAGTSITVNAEDYQGKDGWMAEFNGNKIVSNFESGDLSEEAENIQPGDSITLKVQVKNSDKDPADWYMTNEVLQSLEDAQSVADGGAYEYRLAYTDASGAETEIYNSENIGGENSVGKEGLHQATDSLEDYFFLDRLDAGDSGMVTLRVKVEGETQNNDYQKTLAKLKMTFAVEKGAAGTVTERIPGKNTIITNRVKTGDTTQVLLFCALGLGSGIVLLILGLRSMKKHKTGRKGERRI